MKLKPLVEALGMRPIHWSQFSFISKQVYWDEKMSHTDKKFTFRPGSKPAPAPTAEGVMQQLFNAQKILDAQPVPQENREVI